MIKEKKQSIANYRLDPVHTLIGQKAHVLSEYKT